MIMNSRAQQSATPTKHTSVFLAAAALAAMLYALAVATPGAPDKLPVASEDGRPEVALVGAHARRTAGLVIVTGTVRSSAHSGRHGLEAFAALLDTDGCALEVRSSLVETAGGRHRLPRPFKLILDDLGGGVSVRVWFQPFLRVTTAARADASGLARSM